MPKAIYLGEFEQIVLMALVRLSPNAYGAAIWREIEKRGGREVTASTVYSTLDQLMEKDFVACRWGDTTPVQGGRAKKYFRITTKGLKALNSSLQTVNKMQEGLNLGTPTPKPIRA